MTLDEAIEEIKRWTSILMSAGNKCVSATAEAQDMAIKALEENQKYRDTIEMDIETTRRAIINNAILEVYESIGTPEECSAAVEKQKAKKPKKTESEGYRYTDTYRCPNCGGNFSGTGIANYCYHCGQKLDWGDVE